MFTKIERALILIGLFLFSITIFLFAVYGGIQFSIRSERIEMARLFESQQAKIVNLELKVRELRRLNDFVPAMEQIFTPMILDELKLLSEVICQKRYKSYEAIEQPLITEKERN